MSMFTSKWLEWEKKPQTLDQATDKTDESHSVSFVSSSPKDKTASISLDEARHERLLTDRPEDWEFRSEHGGVIAKHLRSDFEVFWPFKTNPDARDCDLANLLRKAERSFSSAPGEEDQQVKNIGKSPPEGTDKADKSGSVGFVSSFHPSISSRNLRPKNEENDRSLVESGKTALWLQDDYNDAPKG